MEELYNKLKKEHGLPDLEVMDKEFEITTIEEERFLLREIRKKIDEKAEGITKILEGILHPDNTFSSLREADVFTDKEREKILELYQKLMYQHRKSTELGIEDSDKKNIEFINGFMEEWPKIKQEALESVSKLKESWTKDITKKEVVGYLG